MVLPDCSRAISDALPARRVSVKRRAFLNERYKKKPADGSTHWSQRKLADELGYVSHMTIARAWAKHRLKPHRLGRYLTSNDPEFESKAADIIGLYMNPPQHAAVFSVDEKTAIQALDRKDRGMLRRIHIQPNNIGG